MRRSLTAVLLLTGALWLAPPAAAQQLPGNATIKGTYNFRYLGVFTNPNDVALSYGGTITFDGTSDANGNGGFTVTGQGAGATLGPTSNNIYGVFSNGLIYMNNPFDTSGSTGLFGGVSNGALILSSTDSYYCDLLVAVPQATSASNSTLSGNYFLASLEFLGGNIASSTRNTFFPATANGGSFGTVTVRGTSMNSNGSPQTQTNSGVTYSVNANGTGTITFPAPSGVAASNVLISGSKTLYVSQDGSFFVAGGSSAYDMVVGVKAISGNPSGVANGLYFQGFLENLVDTTQTPPYTIYAANGSANEVGSLATEIGHQRIQPDFTYAFDETYAADLTLASNGTAVYSNSQYAVGTAGNFIIGSGNGSNYQIAIYAKAPSLSGTSVFLNPQGIVNAASFAPFTASVSPGEFLSLFGTGLSSQTLQAQSLPFGTSLGGVSVNISWFDSNGNLQSALAPVQLVSPTLINIVVPYSTPGDGTPLSFQVMSNGTPSNSAIVYSGPSSPGIFTQAQNGLGDGAIRHATDNSVVTTANPAKVGETVSIYLTSMGAVSPAVTAGTAAPSSPLSQTVLPDVFIDGQQATVSYSGLAPGLAGLYQLNVTIPSGVTAGTSVFIEVDSYDDANDLLSSNFQATIPISK
ncbi:MAG TPA: hypothetical protein VMH81_16725 [Bryobacteraceae bacterium]|nr:hypothetical protein [Bryobacteraceae bacterium]